MIKINQLSKAYFARELFTDVSFQMNSGDRLGLVGRNGHGKSTLFKLILGEEEPDSGEIVIPRNYRIGHLEQHLHFAQPTILDEAALGLPEDEAHSIYKAEAILFGHRSLQPLIDIQEQLREAAGKAKDKPFLEPGTGSVLDFTKAVDAGAEIRLKSPVEGLRRDGTRVVGIRARDPFRGQYDVDARVVVDASGHTGFLAR